MITLIMLVVMTLAAIALIRSTDTTNLIAGNVAFQQGATNSAQEGVEAAVTWLGTNAAVPSTLWLPVAGHAEYSPISCGPSTTSNWQSWWGSGSITCAGNTLSPVTTTDSANNTVSYVIERLCNATGDPWAAASGVVAPIVCESPSPVTEVTSQGATAIQLLVSGPVFYRITSHVQGAKNTQSLVQVIVSQ